MAAGWLCPLGEAPGQLPHPHQQDRAGVHCRLSVPGWLLLSDTMRGSGSVVRARVLPTGPLPWQCWTQAAVRGRTHL